MTFWPGDVFMVGNARHTVIRVEGDRLVVRDWRIVGGETTVAMAHAKLLKRATPAPPPRPVKPPSLVLPAPMTRSIAALRAVRAVDGKPDAPELGEYDDILHELGNEGFLTAELHPLRFILTPAALEILDG